MTLHWWMHWFWVTIQIAVILSNPTTNLPINSITIMSLDNTTLPPTTTTTTTTTTNITTNATTISIKISNSTEGGRINDDTLVRLQQNYRIYKAIGIQNTTSSDLFEREEMVNVTVNSNNTTIGTNSFTTTAIPSNFGTNSDFVHNLRPQNNKNKTITLESGNNRTVQYIQPSRIPSKKENKTNWITTINKTKSKTDEKSSTMSPEDLTVMPLKENFDYQSGSIRKNSISNNSNDKLFIGPEESIEPPVVGTTTTFLEGASLGDSTRLGRSRNPSIKSDFQHHEQFIREEGKKKIFDEPVSNKSGSNGYVTEIATITGSCLAVIVLLSTVGSIGFIMYRRRYLNPPQTLNSDKCSNPDSSGYIDDSTIRDNSEEMYSLDNDSFLNSLEAMTIQNYWTDSVKHTKL